MTTREEFLQNPGLVPVYAVEQCSICQEESAVAPVYTPLCECRVVYCRECILTWFQHSNKCPTCATRFYESDDSEIEEDDDVETLYDFGLPVVLVDGTAFVLDNFIDAEETAMCILEYREWREENAGLPPANNGDRTFIDTDILIDVLLQEGNAMYSSESMQGPFTEAETRDFSLLMAHFCRAIISLDDQMPTFAVLYNALLRVVAEDLRHTSPIFADLFEALMEHKLPDDATRVQRFLWFAAEILAREAERLHRFYTILAGGVEEIRPL